MQGNFSTHRFGSWPRRVMVAAVCAACILGGAAWRTATAGESTRLAAQPPTAIAIMNLKKLFDGLTEFAEKMTVLKEQKEASAKQLSDIEEQIKKLDTELELIKDKDSPDRLKKVGQKIVLIEQGKVLKNVLQQVLDIQAGAVTRGMYNKSIEAAEKLMKTDGWDMVLVDDRGISPPEKVGERGITVGEVDQVIQQRQIIAAVERVDITDSLITMMNNEYKSPKKK